METLVPVFNSIVKSIKFLSTVWDIGRHQIEFLKLHCQYSTLMRMLRLGKVLFNRNWKIFRKNSCTWISFRSFAKIPIPVVSINFYGSFFPSFLANFGFIYANDIRFRFLKIIIEIFLIKNRSDAINIPWRNEKFIRSFSSAILPISLIGFSMSDSIAELFRPGFSRFAWLLDDFLGEEFGLFFFFFFWRFFLRFGFLIDFFWRHNLIILLNGQIKSII